MEYKMDSKDISVSKTVLETSCEQPIDINFILPDYCPDIQKILKCCVYPKIISKKLSNSNLTIDGDINIKVIYADANDKKAKYCEYSMPFSHTFPLSVPEDELIMPIVYVNVDTEYVNCRAVSPRKLDIHGAFVISVKILCKSKQEIITGISSDDVEQKKENIVVSNVISQSQQNFPLAEILELPKGKPTVETIIRTSLKASIRDCKTVENKIILKGEAILKLLYASNLSSSEFETMEYTIPISQIVDIDGMSEDASFTADIAILNYSCNIHSDSAGDDTLIDLEAKLCAGIIVYEDLDLQVLNDAYSRDYSMNLDYKLTTTEKILDTLKENYINKTIIPSDEENIAQITDVWNEYINATVTHHDGALYITGKFNACILALNENNEAVFFEKNINFEHTVDISSGENLKCDLAPYLNDISFRITGSGDIEVKTDIIFSINIKETMSHNTVCYAFCDEDKPLKKDNTAVVIYYANENESVWDIARLYGSSVRKITEENELDSEELTGKTVLFIPV